MQKDKKLTPEENALDDGALDKVAGGTTEILPIPKDCECYFCGKTFFGTTNLTIVYENEAYQVVEVCKECAAKLNN